MNQNFKDLFSDSQQQGPVIDIPPMDTELNIKGKAVGTGAERYCRIIIPVFLILNSMLLTIVLGTVFRRFFLSSPIFMLTGHITAFFLLVLALIITSLFWCVSGNSGPIKHVYSQFLFGTQDFQSICSLVLIFVLLLVIFLRAYRHIYLSKRVLIILVLVNSGITILLLSFLGQYFGLI